jgi:hypothetical protein
VARRTPESRVKDEVMREFRRLRSSGLPVDVFRRQAGGFSPDGLPDLYAVVGGIHLEIELKSDDGDLRPEQATWKERLIADGAEYVLARSAADVAEAVSRILKRK